MNEEEWGKIHKRNYRYYYTRHGTILTSWIQPICIICKRFLSKRQFKYCSKCKEDKRRERQREWNKRNRDKMSTYQWAKRKGLI